MRRAFAILITLLIASSVRAATVQIPASRDATLIENPDGILANGSGPFFFVGRTNQAEGSIRRSLVLFDVASALPEHALIEGVSLTLYMAPSNPGPRDLDLHRVLTDWGEGPSSSAGGGGAPSQPGDVTWLHTFFDQEFWTVSGGQFVGVSSASQTVDTPGFCKWQSTNHLVNDVRLWLSAPRENFGWILIGGETQRQTAKSFASRENADPSLWPVLSVSYTLAPGQP